MMLKDEIIEIRHFLVELATPARAALARRWACASRRARIINFR